MPVEGHAFDVCILGVDGDVMLFQVWARFLGLGEVVRKLRAMLGIHDRRFERLAAFAEDHGL